METEVVDNNRTPRTTLSTTQKLVSTFFFVSSDIHDRIDHVLLCKRPQMLTKPFGGHLNAPKKSQVRGSTFVLMIGGFPPSSKFETSSLKG